LIDQTYGRDISKFFYGGYALDGNIGIKPGEDNNAYPHSNVARIIAKKHIVYILERRDVQTN
jgi:hypothetical protein